MNTRNFLIMAALAVLALFIFSACKSSAPREKIDNFATCLTTNNVTMYGAFWCPHCARTKKRFGESFRYITYVECDPRGEKEQSELCIQKGIDKYDTWEFTDGSRLVSEPTFEQLAEKSGCEAPR